MNNLMLDNVLSYIREIGILVIIAIIFIITTIFLISIIMLINQFRRYIRDIVEAKKIYYMTINQEKHINIPADKQITITKELMKLIDELISNEVTNKLRNLAALQEKYEYLNTADDVREISQIVFDGFKKENLFNNPDVFITDEYIMKYIAQQTSLLFLSSVKDYNSKIRDTR